MTKTALIFDTKKSPLTFISTADDIVQYHGSHAWIGRYGCDWAFKQYYYRWCCLGDDHYQFDFLAIGLFENGHYWLGCSSLGINDKDRQFQLLVQGISLTLILSLIILGLQSPILNLALSFADASSEVLKYCGIFSYPDLGNAFALLNLVFLGYLLGCQNPKQQCGNLF